MVIGKKFNFSGVILWQIIIMKMQSEKLLTTSGKIPDARPVWKASTGLWLLSSCIIQTAKALALPAKNALLRLAKKLLPQARKKAAALLLKRLQNSFS